MLDPTNDSNLTLLNRIVKEHSVPDFVKSASMTDLDVFPNSAFADPVHRRFPCNSPANTYVSYAYYLRNASRMRPKEAQDMADRFTKFGNDWGIANNLLRLREEHEKLAAQSLESLPDSDFALVTDYDIGGETKRIRMLPLLNGTCVEKAAAHLVSYKERYPYTWRRSIARNILAKQAQFGAAIPDEYEDYLTKAAGYGWSSYSDIARAMWGRAMQVNGSHRGSDEQVALVKVAKALAEREDQPDASTLEKAAEALDTFDRHFNLGSKYHEGMQTPEEIAFGVLTTKAATELRGQFVTTNTGSSYRLRDLVDAGIRPYKVVGDDLASAVRGDFSAVDQQKVADIVPTLPRDDALLLDRALAKCGIKTASDMVQSLGLDPNPQRWTRTDWDRYQQAIG